MPKPSSLPRWATTGSITIPTELKKDTGWLAGEKPPAQFFNWLLNLTYQWLFYLDAFESEVHQFTVQQQFLTSFSNSSENILSSGIGVDVTGNGTAKAYGIWVDTAANASGIYAKGGNSGGAASGGNGAVLNGGAASGANLPGAGLVATAGAAVSGGTKWYGLQARGNSTNSAFPNSGISALGGGLNSSAGEAGHGIVSYGGDAISGFAGYQAPGTGLKGIVGQYTINQGGGSTDIAHGVYAEGEDYGVAIKATNREGTQGPTIRTNGYMVMNGSQSPTGTNSIEGNALPSATRNVVTPLNTCRSWVSVTGNGTSAPTKDKGFNVTSVTNVTATEMVVNFTGAMPDVNYSVSLTNMGNHALVYFVKARTTSSVTIQAVDLFGGPLFPADFQTFSGIVKFSMQIFG